MFIPELKCNLISLGQLMEYTNCFIFMSNGMCVIQDSISMMPIGIGAQKNGIILYRLINLAILFASCVCSSESRDLWNNGGDTLLIL